MRTEYCFILSLCTAYGLILGLRTTTTTLVGVSIYIKKIQSLACTGPIILVNVSFCVCLIFSNFRFPKFMFCLINNDEMSNMSASKACFLLRLLRFLMKIVAFQSKMLSVYDITGFLRTAYRPFAYCVQSTPPPWILHTKFGGGGCHPHMWLIKCT